MDEVSGKFAKWVYESGIADGVPEETLLAGVNVAVGLLQEGKDRIGWDDYVQMLENYHAVVGLEGMRDSALKLGTSKEIETLAKVAGQFLSPRRLYQFMYRWAGTHYLRNVEFELEDLDGGNLKIVSKISADSRGSEVYFKTLTNVLAGNPIRIGYEPAEVEIVSVSSHRAEYRLVMPKGGSRLSRLLALPGKLIRSRGAEKEIVLELQEEVRERQSAVARQQKDFASMIESLADPLFIVDADGAALFVNRIARTWFMVPNDLESWRPEQVLRPVEVAKWPLFLEASDVGEREFSFTRKDQGGATVDLSFQPPQTVSFGGKEARLLVGRDVTDRRRVEKRMREAAFEERCRLAAEIHDVLGQQLTVVSLRSDTLAARLAGTDVAKADEASSIAEIARAAIVRARDLAHGLAAIDERPDNLRRGLVDFVSDLRRGVEIEIRLQLPEEEELTLPGQRALEVLRIVQEASHNALKHSGGRQLEISLTVGDGIWTLSVIDDGKGIEPGVGDSESGMGLGTMGVRANRIGGSLEIVARKDGVSGTAVRLTLPVSGEPVADTEVVVGDGRGIRLVIADDQEIVLDGFVARLSLEPDIEICGQVLEQDEIVPTVMAARPDVLLTDMMMGAEDNLRTIAMLRSQLPNMGIVVISMLHEEAYGADSLAAGADAYLMKSSATSEVIRVIREVAAKPAAG